uniref:H15 domain-containing protein n=1 Tax=Timema monikensis TaxID=170555 RepID=A0A7R9E2D9_9NEOP|nr:unnamed protein product [Timema monikensis]
MANALVVLSPTAEDGEIEVRISVGKTDRDESSPTPEEEPGPSSTSHPPTSTMVLEAIVAKANKGGVSVQAIKKFIAEKYLVDIQKYKIHIKTYLSMAVISGEVIQVSGKGFSGSFKTGKSVKAKDAELKKPKSSKMTMGKKTRPSLKVSKVRRSSVNQTHSKRLSKTPFVESTDLSANSTVVISNRISKRRLKKKAPKKTVDPKKPSPATTKDSDIEGSSSKNTTKINKTLRRRPSFSVSKERNSLSKQFKEKVRLQSSAEWKGEFCVDEESKSFSSSD